MNNNLKKLRMQRGLVIWGLSAQSGVSPSLLSAIEKHGYIPSPQTQQRIADAMRLSIEEIWPAQDKQPTVSTQL